MLHGFGPAVLAATPREGSATVREIQAGVSWAPDIGTVRRHLANLVALGCVQREAGGYRRLLDSELDVGAAS